MLRKIIEKCYYTTEKELDSHKKRIDNVVNAKVLCINKTEKYIEVEINYE